MAHPHDPFRARQRGRRGRREATRERRLTFLIICEGEKTEPLYFKSFPAARAVARIEGIGDNTLRLVEQAIEKRNEYRGRGMTFEQTWCVFDRDSFPAQHFNEAIRLAQAEGMHVAYSNEAFELWYVLHYSYHQSAWTRDRLKSRLQELVPGGYRKNRDDIYDLLHDQQRFAIANAERLLQRFQPCNPEQDNPSTTVFRLVELLNRSGRAT